jgi:hypothetical protein
MKLNWAIILLLLIFSSCRNSVNNPAEEKTLNDSQIIDRSENIITVNPNLDISPMDMIYFPVDYPVQKMTNKISDPPVARIIYSRPRVQGREIFGELIKYDKPWRLGANESTEIDLFREINIQGVKVPAGRYILYCIPKEKTWTIVFNSNIDSWGLRMDQSKDLHRFVIPVMQTIYREEFFSMFFEGTTKGMNLVISWDQTMARLPISYK